MSRVRLDNLEQQIEAIRSLLLQSTEHLPVQVEFSSIPDNRSLLMRLEAIYGTQDIRKLLLLRVSEITYALGAFCQSKRYRFCDSRVIIIRPSPFSKPAIHIADPTVSNSQYLQLYVSDYSTHGNGEGEPNVTTHQENIDTLTTTQPSAKNTDVAAAKAA